MSSCSKIGFMFSNRNYTKVGNLQGKSLLSTFVLYKDLFKMQTKISWLSGTGLKKEYNDSRRIDWVLFIYKDLNEKNLFNFQLNSLIEAMGT